MSTPIKNFTNGDIAIVLHAHLPYVRSSKKNSLEQDWFYQALMECYLPLLQILENSLLAEDQDPKITIGLSPTLLSLLENKDLKDGFKEWISTRLDLLKQVPICHNAAVEDLSSRIIDQLNNWNNCNGELISRFAELERKGVVDLLTCAATHGYLPLLRENKEAVKGQLNTAVREHIRIFGSKPLGIWLPECAYYEGLDKLMIEAGLRYAILDGHGLLNAHPRPRYGIYAPICTANGVAFFARDSTSTLPVWSAKEGFPGDPLYREFHRDLGWDLPKTTLEKIGLAEPRPLGLKLHRVTGHQIPLEKKSFYEPYLAAKRVKEHAKDYLQGRHNQLKGLANTMGIKPVLVAPFDAELFGHWWFEGPNFLSELFLQAKEEKVHFTRLKDVLNTRTQLQLCEPSPSSWGQGGFHDYWLNESNSWIIPEWSKASKALINCSNIKNLTKSKSRLIHQAARELLLSQSSDWSFILRAGTTTELAKDRINLHLGRFWLLIRALENKNNLAENVLIDIEQEDSLFPLIDISDWKQF